MSCQHIVDFLCLVNAVGRGVKKHSPSYQELPTLDSKFQDHGYDSLDCLMLCIYISDAYGLSEEASKKLFPMTAAELELAIMQNKTKEPVSIADVVAEI